ncbi:MAG: hypothetical protein QUU85_05400, partial [Candidatus Eisenbacteria bacterium]|nr:hypothetical protein [Candidatus Eisenbacteria bacterium]
SRGLGDVYKRQPPSRSSSPSAGSSFTAARSMGLPGPPSPPRPRSHRRRPDPPRLRPGDSMRCRKA